MPTKCKVSLFSGPKDGLILYWEEIDTDVIFFEYSSITRVEEPDHANFEYHVYSLMFKDGNEYSYHYSGVSPMEPQCGY